MGYTLFYRLNGNAADSSGNLRNGTTTSVSWVAGRVGLAADLNGTSSYINTNTASNVLIPNKNSWSIVVWFNPDVVSNDTILALGDSVNSSVLVLKTTGSSTVQYTYIYDVEGSAVNKTVGSFSTGNWYHLVLTYDGTTYRGYLNGGSLASSVNNFIGCGTNKCLIGKLTAATNYFDGKINEVRIYDRTLTSDEVYHLYTGDPLVQGSKSRTIRTKYPYEEGLFAGEHKLPSSPYLKPQGIGNVKTTLSSRENVGL